MQQKLMINRLFSVVCLLSTILGTSTIVENPLQINLFMQNKAKVKIGKMNVSVARIKAYDKNNKQPATNVIQNKANQSQFLETMDVNFCAKGYYESLPAVRVAGKPIDGLWENAKS